VRFMHAFLMTYLSFTNPRTLLNKLIERCFPSSLPSPFPTPYLTSLHRYRVPATTHSADEAKRIQLRYLPPPPLPLPPSPPPPPPPPLLTISQPRVCNVLKNWVSRHFDDFDHDLIQTVITFVDEDLTRDGHDSGSVKMIRNAIVKRVWPFTPPLFSPVALCRP